jgi:hypothetical protein
MTYNPQNQFRCTIIRGKAKNDLDSLLPTYAKIIEEICPISIDNFPEIFNKELKRLLPEATKKTLDNHRTEIAGKLFGMYTVEDNDIVNISEKAKILIGNNDQPAFFKDICFKFQFPNGMDSLQTLEEKIRNGIKIRQFAYILQLLLEASTLGKSITKNEIGYYVLNSLDVLQGKIPPAIVLNKILSDREAGVINTVHYEGKASSYSVQHINEQLTLLELANLIRIISGSLMLNIKETTTIKYIASFWDKPLAFDIYKYSLTTVEERNRMYKEWDTYYSKSSDDTLEKFSTSVDALAYNPISTVQITPSLGRTNLVELGDEGELYVYNFEMERVSKYDRRLVNKVKLLGKMRGIGYDIQSIVAESGEEAEFVKYLEVKSTKRVTAPKLDDVNWDETINLTRNEWVAAQQHGRSYFIYRVYFTSEGVMTDVLHDPFRKNSEGVIRVVPTNYRMDFKSKAIDFRLE